MFTGLVQLRSKVISVTERETGLELIIERPSEFTDLKVGESIAVDGVCLTLEAQNPMKFFVGEETLRVTKWKFQKPSDNVHLERALLASDRLGGHMVSGHVDGIGEVVKAENSGLGLNLSVRLPEELLAFAFRKGSIAIDGVSLTINEVHRDSRIVDFYLIPETLKVTHLGSRDLVNIECDQVAKMIVETIKTQRQTHNEYS